MSKDKFTPDSHAKKNTAASLVRSSAAEYLTFVAGGNALEWPDSSIRRRQHQ